MKSYTRGNIKISELEPGDTFMSSIANNPNLIIHDKSLTDLKIPENLHVYNYPEYISYKIRILENRDLYLNTFSSNSRKLFKKRYTGIEEKYHVLLVNDLNHDILLQWYEGYLEFLKSLPFGIDKIKNIDEWYKKDRGEDKFFAIFLFDKESDKIMKGGQIIKYIPKEKKYSLSYSWFKEETRKEGASTFIILYLYELAVKNNIEVISFGKDTNLYGGNIPISLHDFKLSWKSEPYIPRETRLLSLLVNDTLPNPIKFYSLDNENKMSLVTIP